MPKSGVIGNLVARKPCKASSICVMQSCLHSRDHYWSTTSTVASIFNSRTERTGALICPMWCVSYAGFASLAVPAFISRPEHTQWNLGFWVSADYVELEYPCN